MLEQVWAFQLRRCDPEAEPASVWQLLGTTSKVGWSGVRILLAIVYHGQKKWTLETFNCPRFTVQLLVRKIE